MLLVSDVRLEAVLTFLCVQVILVSVMVAGWQTFWKELLSLCNLFIWYSSYSHFGTEDISSDLIVPVPGYC